MANRQNLLHISGNKRGVFFSLDGILAAGILILAIVLIPRFFISEVPAEPLAFFSQDAVNVLSEIQVKEINDPYIAELIQNGTINNPNVTLLEQIGEFWALDDFTNAKNLSRLVLFPLLQNYAVYVDGDLVDNKGSPTENVLVSKRLVSGITKSQPILGFSSRAFLKKATKNTTFILQGDVITSSVRRPGFGGSNGNHVNITYNFTLPTGLIFHNTSWQIVPAWTNVQSEAFINDQYIPGSTSIGSKLLTNIDPYLQEGVNTATATYWYGTSGNEGGEDGSSHIVVDYSTDEFATFVNSTKKYLAEVHSYTSIRYKKPIFALAPINLMNVSLHVIAPEVTLKLQYQGTEYVIGTKTVTSNEVSWTDSELQTAFSGFGIDYADLEDEYFWFVFDVDDYNDREFIGPKRAILQNSFVYVDAPVDLSVHGKIDITAKIPASSFSNSIATGFYRDVEWRYNVTDRSIPLFVDSQLAWLYFTSTSPSQRATSNSNVLYDHPPQPFILEFARVGFDQGMGGIDFGENTFTLDFGDGYGVDPHASLVSYTFFLDSSTGSGYGATYPTQQEAIDAATQELLLQVGDYLESVQIETETISLSGVPNLWGPAIVEVRVWG